VHYNAKEAKCDGQQMITPAELAKLIEACNLISQNLMSIRKGIMQG
jgi:3-deoxy-D-arabino-heptulosonate 7-phosphate (DAHP) synthase